MEALLGRRYQPYCSLTGRLEHDHNWWLFALWRECADFKGCAIFFHSLFDRVGPLARCGQDEAV
jgi:hypothetical protein